MKKSFEEYMHETTNDDRLIILKVKKEELEDSIDGLTQLFPLVNRQVIKGNRIDVKQAMEDSKELKKHFDTAITSMTMLLANIDSEV